MKDRLVWVDLEMTGLDPDKDVIVEIAVLITDSDLVPVGEGLDIVIHAPADVLDGMDDVVRDMHARSGLTDAVLASTVSLEEAAAQSLGYIREHVPNLRSAPLCGNSIATDRGFLIKYMPDIDKHLHYRMIDVSSIKELARRWHPKIYQKAPVKGGGHRALADILESVEELRYYRSAMFVPPEPVEEPVGTAPAPSAPAPR
ncbi:MAG: oligoribonuclease [Mycobacteriales bacterium]